MCFMNNNIKISRVIVNIIFFNLYWLLASIIFSFVFPIVLKAFGQPTLNPADPIFINIQIIIVVLILVVSVIFRKYFYLPIVNGDMLDEKKNPKKELELEHDMNVAKQMREKEKQVEEKKDELDIKIGREK